MKSTATMFIVVIVGIWLAIKVITGYGPPYYPDRDGRYEQWQLENMRLKVDSVDEHGLPYTYRDTVSNELMNPDKAQERMKESWRYVGICQKYWVIGDIMGFIIILGAGGLGLTTITTFFYAPGGANAGYSVTYVPTGSKGGNAPGIFAVALMVCVVAGGSWFFNKQHLHDFGEFFGCIADFFFQFMYRIFSGEMFRTT